MHVVVVGSKKSEMEETLAKEVEEIVKVEMKIEMHGLEQKKKQPEKWKKELAIQDEEMEEEEKKKKQKLGEKSSADTITFFLRCDHVEGDDWKYSRTVIDLEETEIKRDPVLFI